MPCFVRVQFHSFPCGYTVFLAWIIGKIALCSLNGLGILNKKQIIIYAQAYFWDLCFFPLVCMFVFMPAPPSFDYCCFLRSFEIVSPSYMFFFFKIVLEGPLRVYMNFRMSFLLLQKNQWDFDSDFVASVACDFLKQNL